MGRAALVAGVANLLGRLSGLLREVVFAAFFGAGMAADAFNAAYRVPNLFRELLAEGTLANVYVPLFAETTEQEGLERAWRLANAMLGLLLLVLGLVTALFLVAAEPFVYLVAAGFAETEGKVALATWLVRLLAPFLAGLSIASLFGGMLNVRGRFFLPAIAPAVLNVFVIAACVLGERWQTLTGTHPIGAVAVGATLSGLVTAGIQYPALRRQGFRFRPTFRWHPGLGRVLKFAGAALVGIVVVQFNLLVETQLASRLGDGPVSWLIYGFRLVQLPQTVVSGSVAVAGLASLSVFMARGEEREANRTVYRALELNSLLVVPAAVGLFVLAQPLVELFYQRGAFRPSDAAATASILEMYAIATVGICTYRVLLPVFFALKDPWLPMKLSLVIMAAKVPVALWLMELYGVDGLPLSHAVTVSFEVLIMLLVLRGRLGGWAPGFMGQHLRIALAAAAMGVAVQALLPWTEGARVLLVCGVGAVVYGVLVLLLGVREARPFARRVVDKIRRRPPPPPPGGLPPGAPPVPPPFPPAGPPPGQGR